MPERELFKTWTMEELLAAADEHRDWAKWRLNAENQSLVWEPHGYDIDLEQCLDSAQVLDWIAQIADKEWGQGETTGLINALDDILHLQASVCPGGCGVSVTKKFIAARCAKAAELWPDMLIR